MASPVDDCQFCRENASIQEQQPLDLRIKINKSATFQTCHRRGRDAGSHRELASHLATTESNPQLMQRRNRTMFSEWQLSELEWRFERNKYLITSDRLRVAKLLKLNQLQVKTWFQNRRMKWKKQILASGCARSPTKPKGRPRRDSIPPIDDDHDDDYKGEDNRTSDTKIMIDYATTDV